MLVNTHIHLPPNFTAFETTRQALELAQTQGIRVLGASNYYDFTVYDEFSTGARNRGIFPLFGLEIISLIAPLVEGDVRINDPGNPGKMYLCGKGLSRFAPMNTAAQKLLQTIRDNDSVRMAEVTRKLSAVFAEAGFETSLDAEAIKHRIVSRHGVPLATVYLQERHIAQAFQEMLFERVAGADRASLLTRAYGVAPKAAPTDAVGTQNEMRSQLLKSGKAAYAAETFVDFDHAYRLILELGGIPCYPTLADGVSPITPYEASVRALIADLKARNMPGAEFIPLRNTPEVLSAYVHALRNAGLFVTAGTEHNTLELLPLAPVCLGNVPIPDDVQEIFLEGACVVAAHQILTAQGLPGFMDGDYASANSRIDAFRKIGEQVIRDAQTAY